jgi:hypothetical protein
MMSKKVFSVLKDTLTEEAAKAEVEPVTPQAEVDQPKVPDPEGEL